MRISSAKDLNVYQAGYDLAMKVFEVSRTFPPEERFALTSQNTPVVAFSVFELARSVGKAKV